MRDYGEYHDRLTRLGLEPLSRSCYQLLYPGYVSSRWRSGRRSLTYMAVEERLARDQLVCYDVCQDFLVLGTLLGQIIIWRLGAESPQQLEASLEQRVDKINIRHGKIIVLQAGLLSVYGADDGKMFRLLYRRSFESPEPRLLGETGLTELSPGELRVRYRARDPVTFPALLLSVSTTGQAEQTGDLSLVQIRIDTVL